MLNGAEIEATFVPGDPPRERWLALWNRHGQIAGAEAELELALPAGSQVRRRTVPVRRMPIGEALDLLIERGWSDDASPSVRAWATADQLALELVGRGRLLPARSPGGSDAWRLGPLDPADIDNLRRPADALPPPAHAIPVSGSRILRVASPTQMVGAFGDAVADLLPRTAAAKAPAFAARAAWPLDGAVPWLETLTAARDEAAVTLRLQPPAGTDSAFRAGLVLSSRTDPGLTVEAASLWDSPELVLARLGDAEYALLVGLRRGARAWPPLGRLLEETRPAEMILSDNEVTDLLGPVVDDLASAGIGVLWPRELLSDVDLGRPLQARRRRVLPGRRRARRRPLRPPGRPRDEVLAALRRLRSTPTAATRPAVSVPAADQGMRATEAWARDLGDLPIPPPPRSRPGSPAVWPVDPPRDASFTAAGLRALAADAAERAWQACRGEGTTGLTDDPDTDLTRRAASALGAEAWPRLVATTGSDPRRLARRAIAWRQGGAAGVKAAEDPLWRPNARVMASGPPGPDRCEGARLQATGPSQYVDRRRRPDPSRRRRQLVAIRTSWRSLGAVFSTRLRTRRPLDLTVTRACSTPPPCPSERRASDRQPDGNVFAANLVTATVLEGAYGIAPDFSYLAQLVESAQPIVPSG